MNEPGPPSKFRRLRHFTPLRYPGGKGRLAQYIKTLMKENLLLDGEYAEPYAGGAAIALELLLHEYVDKVHINDISRPVYAFWKSVLHETDELCKLITDTPVTVKTWDIQKRVLQNKNKENDLALGFAMFFLNRTNRSGILNGGIIGGRDQTGPWKIDARFNSAELVGRIRAIASLRKRIRLSCKDALRFLEGGVGQWPDKTLIYLDPPYYAKGRELYYDFYEPEDHERVAAFVRTNITRQRWVVSYDNVKRVRELYKGCQHIIYELRYSARSSRSGREIMFLSDNLKIPASGGSIRTLKTRRRMAGANPESKNFEKRG